MGGIVGPGGLVHIISGGRIVAFGSWVALDCALRWPGARAPDRHRRSHRQWPRRPARHARLPDFDGDGAADLVAGIGEAQGRVTVRYATGGLRTFGEPTSTGLPPPRSPRRSSRGTWTETASPTWSWAIRAPTRRLRSSSSWVPDRTRPRGHAFPGRSRGLGELRHRPCCSGVAHGAARGRRSRAGRGVCLGARAGRRRGDLAARRCRDPGR